MVLPLLWVLLGALALVLSWSTGSGVFGWAGYLMLGAWLAGAGLSRWGERSVSASRELSANRVRHGGEATVEVRVGNGSRLPVLWLAASESLPAGLPMTGVRGRLGMLAGKGEFRFRYTLQGARRGYYAVGPTVLRTGDLFGLAQREKAGGPASELTVYPRVLAIRHTRAPSRRPAGEVRARRRVMEDPTQVVGVRPHQQGDGLRRIHWRATAHTGRLQSKLFEVCAQVEALVVLNLRRGDYPYSAAEAEERAELAIVTAASLARHVLDRSQRVGLLVLGRDPAGGDGGGVIRVRCGRGREQFASLLSALGRVQLGPGEEPAEVLREEQERLAWGSQVMVVTPGIEKGMAAAITGLGKAGFETDVVLVGRGEEAAGSVGLEAIGVRASRVMTESDVHGLEC